MDRWMDRSIDRSLDFNEGMSIRLARLSFFLSFGVFPRFSSFSLFPTPPFNNRGVYLYDILRTDFKNVSPRSSREFSSLIECPSA